jgi:hypothetical protein
MEFFREPDRLQSQQARIRSALAREAGATERALAALSAHRVMPMEAERVR